MYRLNFILLATFALMACSLKGAAEAPETVTECVAGGAFRTELYGALRSQLDWHGSALQCEGMRRPHGAGARLRFAGEVPFEDRMRKLAFIVALPELEPGATGRELRATVTMIEEEGGRFFSNTEQETCWADIDRQQSLAEGNADSGGDNIAADSYAISGIVYCVAPLPELNSYASITLRDMQFQGRVDWRGAAK